MNFNKVLEKYRKISFSERDKGDRFERLMQRYLLTDPKYSNKLKKVWLWSEFHGKSDLAHIAARSAEKLVNTAFYFF